MYEHLPPVNIDFLVEHSEVQSLDNRVVKKFTSLAKNPIPSAHIYDPTIFRWNFGDGTPMVETSKRTIYHIYEHPGKYIVRHQACNFCACSNWDLCYKQITVKHENDNDNENNNDNDNKNNNDNNVNRNE
jgi:PKD domain